jgi:sporulation integral membrane protein YtvI
MDRVRYQKYLLPVLGALAGTVLFFRFLLPVLLPFAIGLLLAGAAEPAVRFLMRRGGFPRGIAAGISVLALYVILGSLLWLLLRRGFYELSALSGALPQLFASLGQSAARLQAWLDRMVSQIPDGLGQLLQTGIDEFFRGGQALVSRVCEAALSMVSSAVAALPNAFLFLVTAILSSFMISAELPQLRTSLRHALPARWAGHVSAVTSALRQALGGWCIAQLKLMGITFALVTAGLFILRFPYALLFGTLTALIDALPIFGAGTILIPWGAIQFLQGNLRCGIGLLVLYGAAALTRTALEPRFIGQQIGVSPLLTLLALYTGYKFCGILGMLLFPIAAVILRQLWRYHTGHRGK